MNLHNILKDYIYDDKYYKAEGYPVLIQQLLAYSNSHPWFRYYGTMVPDSDEDTYFHYVVVYWSDGNRPTMNTFNFLRLDKLD
jgi:hypothetical protein